jgi:hypothetical protein
MSALLPKADMGLAKIHKFLAENIKTKAYRRFSPVGKILFEAISDAPDTEMKKNSLHYELYGSSTGAEKRDIGGGLFS